MDIKKADSTSSLPTSYEENDERADDNLYQRKIPNDKKISDLSEDHLTVPEHKLTDGSYDSSQVFRSSAEEDYESQLDRSSFTKHRGKCAAACHSCCMPILAKHHPPPNKPSLCQSLQYAFMCPPHGRIARLVTIFLTMCFVYACLWSIYKDEALPGGTIFAVLVLFVACIIGGALVELVRLPPLLGMLIVGCALRNVPVINIGKDIDGNLSSILRNIALVVILTRAGLGLNPHTLRKLSFVVIRLAFLPCLVEAGVAAVMSHFLLGFPWAWAFMLGFILAAVSPAVVVPCMLSLEERGYGIDKGVPTLIIAAASVDDVLAISGFGIVLGIAFSKSDLVLTIFRGPLEALLGVVYGIVMGLILWYFPHRTHKNVKMYRTILLLGGGLFAVFGSNAATVPGAGALGCLTLAFVAAIGWRARDGWDEEYNPVQDVMAQLWVIFQPLLFGLIGNEIVVTTLDSNTVGMGLAVLGTGLVFRMIASFLAVLGTDMTWKERFFVPFAWLPKATVQAAIGPIALDTAKQLGAPADEVAIALKILTIAVLVIIITAPIGAVFITLLGPRLLYKTDRQSVEPHDASIGPAYSSGNVGPSDAELSQEPDYSMDNGRRSDTEIDTKL